jgi:hypothetical protein
VRRRRPTPFTRRHSPEPSVRGVLTLVSNPLRI